MACAFAWQIKAKSATAVGQLVTCTWKYIPKSTQSLNATPMTCTSPCASRWSMPLSAPPSRLSTSMAKPWISILSPAPSQVRPSRSMTRACHGCVPMATASYMHTSMSSCPRTWTRRPRRCWSRSATSARKPRRCTPPMTTMAKASSTVSATASAAKIYLTMSLPTFLHPDLTGANQGDVLTLTGAEGRHAVTVKRLAPGEQVLLVHAPDTPSLVDDGLFVEATVHETRGKDELVVRVDVVGATPAPNPRVTVVQAIPKSERSELAIDLATQAGADEFIAWQSDRCIAKWDAKKAPKALQKWQAQAQSAAKQARRTRVPFAHGPLTTAQLVQHLAEREDCLIYV